MKPHFIVLALIACGAGLSALATWQVQSPQLQSQQQPAAVPIDLVALQQQADAALDGLRRAQTSRLAPVAVADRRYSQLTPTK